MTEACLGAGPLSLAGSADEPVANTPNCLDPRMEVRLHPRWRRGLDLDLRLEANFQPIAQTPDMDIDCPAESGLSAECRQRNRSSRPAGAAARG